MPSNVARFEQLMYLSLGIGIIVSVLEFSYFQSQANVGFILFIQAFVLALFVLFIWLIARRRANWARWTFLVIFLLGLIPYVPNAIELLQRNPVSGGLNLVQLVLQAVALYLVFTGNAANWFKKSPQPTAA
jgi:predicted membrane channel-forming protein YqfA (hemolysin III family)